MRPYPDMIPNGYLCTHLIGLIFTADNNLLINITPPPNGTVTDTNSTEMTDIKSRPDIS